MIPHQFSKRFKKDTDEQFKNDEFEKALSDWAQGFIQCYPHLIEKVDFGTTDETWIFKFMIEDPDREKMLKELK
jgi:hypothetical protein